MKPIHTAELFLPLQKELLSLLRSLAPDDWSRPTVAGNWTVKDIAAHILDGDLRRLSMHRDGYFQTSGDPSPEGYNDLVAYLNDLNATWNRAVGRLSPRMLTDLLEWAGPQVASFFASLDSEGAALWPVAWAGQEQSANWMDIGRDYTEKWHHQAQIRDAVGMPLLMERRWLHPVIALSMYALPHAFRLVEAATGDSVSVVIDGEAGGRWLIVRDESGWIISEGEIANPRLSVRMDADTAWRLFFNGLSAQEAGRRVVTEGDPRLRAAFLSTRAVMV
jgi:uncharacterized protein (TIGR03083 family)